MEEFSPDRAGLSPDHPGCGLVSHRQFVRMRRDGLVPRHIARIKLAGGGSATIYPPGTRQQIARVLALRSLGIRGAMPLRLFLWVDAYPIETALADRDLGQLVGSIVELARRDDDEIDGYVRRLLDSHDPNAFVRWARCQLPDRDDLGDALLQMTQLAAGTDPADMYLSARAVRPLHRLFDAMVPGMIPSAQALADSLNEQSELGGILRVASTIPDWSSQEWSDARDDQLKLVRAGVLPDLPAEIAREAMLPLRLALVVGCGVVRRLQPTAWTSRMAELPQPAVVQLTGSVNVEET